MFRFITRLFHRKRNVEVHVHAHGKQDRHFEVVADTETVTEKSKPHTARSAVKKRYPAKKKLSSKPSARKKSAKKTPSKRKGGK